MTITIELPLPPSANKYWRKGRNGITYVSKEAESFKEEVGWAAVAAQLEPIEGPVGMTIDAYICDTRRDLDNCCKILLDALQGYAYEDDNMVYDYHARRFKAKTRKQGKVIVSIWKL